MITRDDLDWHYQVQAPFGTAVGGYNKCYLKTRPKLFTRNVDDDPQPTTEEEGFYGIPYFVVINEYTGDEKDSYRYVVLYGGWLTKHFNTFERAHAFALVELEKEERRLKRYVILDKFNCMATSKEVTYEQFYYPEQSEWVTLEEIKKLELDKPVSRFRVWYTWEGDQKLDYAYLNLTVDDCYHIMLDMGDGYQYQIVWEDYTSLPSKKT